MQESQQTQETRRVYSVKQIPSLPGYTWLSASSLRHIIFNSKNRMRSGGESIPGNGLAEERAIIRVGRKVLIDLDAFDRWLDDHREDPN
jgi:hypothetical protein|tara:strand:- start:173 stop:439 length:267 start_codon:yes stop_codon:yes gene_type:complete